MTFRTALRRGGGVHHNIVSKKDKNPRPGRLSGKGSQNTTVRRVGARQSGTARGPEPSYVIRAFKRTPVAFRTNQAGKETYNRAYQVLWRSVDPDG